MDNRNDECGDNNYPVAIFDSRSGSTKKTTFCKIVKGEILITVS